MSAIASKVCLTRWRRRRWCTMGSCDQWQTYEENLMANMLATERVRAPGYALPHSSNHCRTSHILTLTSGNDPELDPDREPEPPTKVIDKPVQRIGKRNAGAEGPPKDTPRPAAGGRGGSHQTLNRGDVGTCAQKTAMGRTCVSGHMPAKPHKHISRSGTGTLTTCRSWWKQPCRSA